jgi:hypothetical protein
VSRRATISGQFAPRLIEMLESPAYRALSLSARRVLDRLEIEMAHHGGTDNGKLPVTFDDLERYGIHRQAIAPAIREGQALGFLVITEQGCAGNAEHRSPNLFRLTYRHAKGLPGDGTHEWRKIGTIEVAEALAKAARAARTTREWRVRKTNSSGGKRQNPVVKTNTETAMAPMVETTTAVHSTETTTTIDISGRGRPVPIPSPDGVVPVRTWRPRRLTPGAGTSRSSGGNR